MPSFAELLRRLLCGSQFSDWITGNDGMRRKAVCNNGARSYILS